MSPRRGPRPKVLLLGENLPDTVAHDKQATQATSPPTNTTLVQSITGSSTAPSSSRSTTFRALVPLIRVQQLEAQMATLLHHIQPWIHRSIAKVEERLERNIAQHINRKIAEVHQLVEAFELRVLARQVPPMDVSTVQAAVYSLRADIVMILEARVPQSEAPYADLTEDIVLDALFATSEIPPHLPREHAKRRKGREEDEASKKIRSTEIWRL